MEQIPKKCFAIAAVLVFYVACSAYAEQLNMKPKGNFSETYRHGERPGREQDQQPDKIIELLGVRAGHSVCDIGAGTGFFSFRLAEIVGETGKVYAVDIDQDALNYIKHRMETTGTTNIILVKSEETDPKLSFSSCDKVLIVNTYYRFWAPVTIMKNIRAALKPEGEVAIIGVKKNTPIHGPYHRSELRVSQEEVLSQMDEAGYKFTRSYDFLNTQYFLVFHKQF